jgi:glycosyltransferase involved in cell wall biosynthesis
VLFVGIVRKVKGIDVLLRAIRLLVDDGVRIRLTIAGESFYASYARDYAELTELCTRLGLDDDVQFVGAMNPMQVAAEMRDSSVVVLPSWRETFGVVLAEALACGTPVVATRCGGPEDIVDDQSGLLVNPGDPAALAAALKSVLSNPAYYDPNRLRQHALDRFGRDVVSNQLRSLYEQILT